MSFAEVQFGKETMASEPKRDSFWKRLGNISREDVGTFSKDLFVGLRKSFSGEAAKEAWRSSVETKTFLESHEALVNALLNNRSETLAAAAAAKARGEDWGVAQSERIQSDERIAMLRTLSELRTVSEALPKGEAAELRKKLAAILKENRTRRSEIRENVRRSQDLMVREERLDAAEKAMAPVMVALGLTTGGIGAGSATLVRGGLDALKRMTELKREQHAQHARDESERTQITAKTVFYDGIKDWAKRFGSGDISAIVKGIGYGIGGSLFADAQLNEGEGLKTALRGVGELVFGGSAAAEEVEQPNQFAAELEALEVKAAGAGPEPTNQFAAELEALEVKAAGAGPEPTNQFAAELEALETEATGEAVSEITSFDQLPEFLKEPISPRDVEALAKNLAPLFGGVKPQIYIGEDGLISDIYAINVATTVIEKAIPNLPVDLQANANLQIVNENGTLSYVVDNHDGLSIASTDPILSKVGPDGTPLSEHTIGNILITDSGEVASLLVLDSTGESGYITAAELSEPTSTTDEPVAASTTQEGGGRVVENEDSAGGTTTVELPNNREEALAVLSGDNFDEGAFKAALRQLGINGIDRVAQTTYGLISLTAFESGTFSREDIATVSGMSQETIPRGATRMALEIDENSTTGVSVKAVYGNHMQGADLPFASRSGFNAVHYRDGEITGARSSDTFGSHDRYRIPDFDERLSGVFGGKSVYLDDNETLVLGGYPKIDFSKFFEGKYEALFSGQNLSQMERLEISKDNDLTINRYVIGSTDPYFDNAAFSEPALQANLVQFSEITVSADGNTFTLDILSSEREQLAASLARLPEPFSSIDASDVGSIVFIKDAADPSQYTLQLNDHNDGELVRGGIGIDQLTGGSGNPADDLTAGKAAVETAESANASDTFIGAPAEFAPRSPGGEGLFSERLMSTYSVDTYDNVRDLRTQGISNRADLVAQLLEKTTDEANTSLIESFAGAPTLRSQIAILEQIQQNVGSEVIDPMLIYAYAKGVLAGDLTFNQGGDFPYPEAQVQQVTGGQSQAAAEAGVQPTNRFAAELEALQTNGAAPAQNQAVGGQTATQGNQTPKIEPTPVGSEVATGNQLSRGVTYALRDAFPEMIGNPSATEWNRFISATNNDPEWLKQHGVSSGKIELVFPTDKVNLVALMEKWQEVNGGATPTSEAAAPETVQNTGGKVTFEALATDGSPYTENRQADVMSAVREEMAERNLTTVLTDDYQAHAAELNNRADGQSMAEATKLYEAIVQRDVISSVVRGDATGIALEKINEQPVPRLLFASDGSISVSTFTERAASLPESIRNRMLEVLQAVVSHPVIVQGISNTTTFGTLIEELTKQNQLAISYDTANRTMDYEVTP